MPRPVEFWFEFASPYSYIAAMGIEAAAAEAGVPVRWRPFLLGPVFKAQGWDDSPFNLYPAKGAYLWRDMARECARLGLPFGRPSAFPRGSLPAARLLCAAPDAPWRGAFARAVSRRISPRIAPSIRPMSWQRFWSRWGSIPIP
jgi:2-hydroxychromene-2-carboxylate isomerase